MGALKGIPKRKGNVPMNLLLSGLFLIFFFFSREMGNRSFRGCFLRVDCVVEWMDDGEGV